MKVATSTPDALALRLTLESVLNRIDLHPPGLSATAILCVRRLTPRQIAWSSHGSRAGRVALTWERAVRDELAGLARRAVRPALDDAPTNAEAVVFADRAELLACLARDWAQGNVASRWWWQSLVRREGWDTVVQTTWLDAPEHVPAALEHLAVHRAVAPFVRALGAATTATMCRRVLETHALHHLATWLDRPTSDSSAVSRRTDTDESRAIASSRTASPAPPWRPWVPEALAPELETIERCLIGIALMIPRAPRVVRSETFASELLAWRHQQEDAPVAECSRMTLNLDTSTRPAELTSRMTTDVQPLARSLHETLVAPLRDSAVVSPENSYSDPSVRVAAAEATEREFASRDVDGGAAPATDGEPLRPRHVAAHSMYERDTTQTSLGGLFYLINLGLGLDLYGDFTSPARPGLALPIWDFLFLIGRGLLADEQASDAVWSLLARLAGREKGVAPGDGFEPPGIWRLPVDWLRPFTPDERWAWHASSQRLWVRHPAGFLVLDVPRDHTAGREQLAREMELYGSSYAGTAQHDAAASQVHSVAPLDRWLAWLLPYVRPRLARALGIGDQGDVAPLLVAHRARIDVTSTHLDVTFSLAELPCAIRLAGLDRDPGWVPAASRHVAFHFE